MAETGDIDFFSGISNPFYAVTFRQDVTELRNYCKERKIPFYYGLIYLCCKALQDVPAFACRIRGENVVELGEQKPSFTDLKKGSELFHIVTMPCDGSIVEFCERAREVSSKQDCFIDMAGQADDLIYTSPSRFWEWNRLGSYWPQTPETIPFPESAGGSILWKTTGCIWEFPWRSTTG